MPDPLDDERPRRVGGATLVAAPLWVLGVAGFGLAVATAIWGAWPDHRRTGAFWVLLVVAAVIGCIGFAGASGCFVEVRGGAVRDVVMWVTVHRVDRGRIRTARVAKGAWRWYVLELDDGSDVVLWGASPLQWPARLAPGAHDADTAALRDLLGPSGHG